VTASLERSQNDLASLIGNVEQLAGIVEGWDDMPRGAAQAYGRAIEALYGEALLRLVRELKTEPHALAAMKRAAVDEVVYAVLRRQEILRPSLNERVESALASVRPLLASHGGDVELVSVEPPAIFVRFLGACDGCPASALTFHEGVSKAIKDACPEITTIEQVKGVADGIGVAHAEVDRGDGPLISPFALQRTGRWCRVTELEAIPEGGVLGVEVEGQSLLLARLSSVVTGFENACAHLGLPLDQGRVEAGVLECPHHGLRYDLTSGQCLTAPSVGLRSRSVRIIADQVEVRRVK
jgi:Fe-S cluster biogenesis protein NfuA/nitrite reductase/ring-hydroxylating ferredoxin subunit